MLLFLEDEDLQDAEFMNALEDELNEAEKICKNYGYNAEFWIDYKKKLIHGDIYQSKRQYAPRIYIEDEGKFGIEIQTTSYGSLNIDEFIKFKWEMDSALKLAQELEKNFYICSQLVKD